MNTEQLYAHYAQELIEQLTRLGHQMTPMTRNLLYGEMAVMRALHKASSALTPSELAIQSHVSSARVANILLSLEKKHWVERQHSSTDRRRVEVHLTNVGNNVCEERRANHDHIVGHVLKELGEKDTAELIRIIGALSDIMAAHESKGTPLA